MATVGQPRLARRNASQRIRSAGMRRGTRRLLWSSLNMSPSPDAGGLGSRRADPARRLSPGNATDSRICLTLRAKKVGVVPDLGAEPWWSVAAEVCRRLAEPEAEATDGQSVASASGS